MAVTQYNARTSIGDTFSLGYDDGNGNFIKSPAGYEVWLIEKYKDNANDFLTIQAGSDIITCGAFNAYLATVTVKDE